LGLLDDKMYLWLLQTVHLEPGNNQIGMAIAQRRVDDKGGYYRKCFL